MYKRQGEQTVKVDASGNVTGQAGAVPAKAGSDIKLTLDLKTVSYTHLDVYKRQVGDYTTAAQAFSAATQDASYATPFKAYLGLGNACLLYTSRCV